MQSERMKLTVFFSTDCLLEPARTKLHYAGRATSPQAYGFSDSFATAYEAARLGREADTIFLRRLYVGRARRSATSAGDRRCAARAVPVTGPCRGAHRSLPASQRPALARAHGRGAAAVRLPRLAVRLRR